MDIIGHQKNIYFLERSIANKQLAHAYLFYGPKGVGRATVAEYFISRLFCQNKKGPCGQCPACQQVSKRIHPDVFWIQDSLKKEKISIEQARQAQTFLFSTPIAAPYKIVIIKEVENFTLPAANSFLKILEEPPDKSIIILIGRSFNNIIPTLRSRCQVLRFNFPLRREIIDYLKDKCFLSQTESLTILNFALGQPGRAIKFAQDTEKIEQRKKITKQMLSFLNIDADNKFRLADLIVNSEISQKQALENLLIVVRDILLAKLNLNPINQEFFKQLKSLSLRYSFKKITDLIEGIYQIEFLLAANVNPRLAIEAILINNL